MSFLRVFTHYLTVKGVCSVSLLALPLPSLGFTYFLTGNGVLSVSLHPEVRIGVSNLPVHSQVSLISSVCLTLKGGLLCIIYPVPPLGFTYFLTVNGVSAVSLSNPEGRTVMYNSPTPFPRFYLLPHSEWRLGCQLI